MRQAGILKDEREARRFAAWLVTQRIEAHAESEGDAWTIWVRDEDQIRQAREALSHFQAHPQDPKYRNAERSAEQLLREEEEQRQRAKGNIVEMRGRWGVGGTIARRCPLVLALIGASILVTLFASSGETQALPDGQARPAEPSPLEDSLLFSDRRSNVDPEGKVDIWANIRRFELWRIITPIFIHYGAAHLIFNMIWLFTLGGQIENRRGTRFMSVLILVLAVTSNLGQALEASLVDPSGFRFGGMSGVCYGIFGFLLVKVKFDNRDNYVLSQMTVIIGIAWFVLCIARSFPEMDSVLAFMPRIANTAHTVGFFVGMALAYAPLLVRRAA